MSFFAPWNFIACSRMRLSSGGRATTALDPISVRQHSTPNIVTPVNNCHPVQRRGGLEGDGFTIPQHVYYFTCDSMLISGYFTTLPPPSSEFIQYFFFFWIHTLGSWLNTESKRSFRSIRKRPFEFTDKQFRTRWISGAKIRKGRI